MFTLSMPMAASLSPLALCLPSTFGVAFNATLMVGLLVLAVTGPSLVLQLVLLVLSKVYLKKETLSPGLVFYARHVQKAHVLLLLLGVAGIAWLAIVMGGKGVVLLAALVLLVVFVLLFVPGALTHKKLKKKAEAQCSAEA